MSFVKAIRPLVRLRQPSITRTMHIQSIPMCECALTGLYMLLYTRSTDDKLLGTGKGNNYAYLVTDEPTKDSVIIDPANPPE